MLTYTKLRSFILKQRQGRFRINTNKDKNWHDTTPIYYFNPKERTNTICDKTNPVDYQKLDIFHRAVYPIIFLGQIFGIMPVLGIGESNPKQLRFTYKSPRVLWAVAFAGFAFTFLYSMLKSLLKTDINAKNIVGVIFFSSTMIITIMFLLLAKRWPQIMKKWTKTEMIFLRKSYEMPKKKLSKRIRVAVFVIIFFGCVEHSLHYMSAVYSYYRKMEFCNKNSTQKATFFNFFSSHHKFLFEVIPESDEIKIPIAVINAALTFTWNFIDLFIIVISFGLAYRFEQIKVRLSKLLDKNVPEIEFIEIRENYVKLCELLEYVDDNLSGIILLSSGNNLYFICQQMLNIFNKYPWSINYIYFWYSLIYLIFRSAFVFLAAATINDESNESVNILRRVSRHSWCIEVERLIFQMSSQTVALSGKKFFYLTKRLLFAMAGTLVTYELVLLQVDEPNRSKGLQSLC